MKLLQFLFGAQCWIVSVVMVKDIPTGYNSQNKLYRHIGINRDEAIGRAIRLAQDEYPQHRLHTACAIYAGQSSDEVIPNA